MPVEPTRGTVQKRARSAQATRASSAVARVQAAASYLQCGTEALHGCRRVGGEKMVLSLSAAEQQCSQNYHTTTTHCQQPCSPINLSTA